MGKYELDHILDIKVYFNANTGCILVQIAGFIEEKALYLRINLSQSFVF